MYDKKRPSVAEDMARMKPARAQGAKLLKGHMTRPMDIADAAERVQAGGATSKVRLSSSQLEGASKAKAKQK
jgi:hypothetical protein